MRHWPAPIAAAGGYGMPATRLMIGLAAGVAAGSLPVGVAWDQGRRGVALCILARKRASAGCLYSYGPAEAEAAHHAALEEPAALAA